jgi:hypothetical protein
MALGGSAADTGRGPLARQAVERVGHNPIQSIPTKHGAAASDSSGPSPGHRRLFRRKPRKSEKPRKALCLRDFLSSAFRCGPVTSSVVAYTSFGGNVMPRYVEPKSELAFRNAKTGPKPYLLPDGQGLSLRTRPNGAKTWLLRYPSWHWERKLPDPWSLSRCRLDRSAASRRHRSRSRARGNRPS